MHLYIKYKTVDNMSVEKFIKETAEKFPIITSKYNHDEKSNIYN